MSENVGECQGCRKWLATTRQLSAPVGALLYTEFAGYLSGSIRTEGEEQVGSYQLDLIKYSSNNMRAMTRTHGALVLGRALSLGETIN